MVFQNQINSSANAPFSQEMANQVKFYVIDFKVFFSYKIWQKQFMKRVLVTLINKFHLKKKHNNV